jgi:glycosyltransferase involved in cell wall biosynthesis
MKKRLAFVDHAYHARTRSSEPVLRLLRERYRVDLFLDGVGMGWRAFDPARLRGAGYDTVLFWQMLYDVDTMRSLGVDNVVVVPMFDSLEHYEKVGWDSLRGLKVVCFSDALGRVLDRNGLAYRNFRYFPPLPDTSVRFSGPPGLRGFFWHRRPVPSWREIRALIDGTRFESLHIHAAADPGCPGFVGASPEERASFGMSFSRWVSDSEDYMRMLRRANVYFAPRVVEGIGMGFLEAMALGHCVVAPDAPTMNEYIEHGVTGLLYDPNDPRPLDFGEAARIGATARERMREGRARWLRAERDLVAYVEGIPRAASRGREASP